jgi:hypothetical protein
MVPSDRPAGSSHRAYTRRRVMPGA